MIKFDVEIILSVTHHTHRELSLLKIGKKHVFANLRMANIEFSHTNSLQKLFIFNLYSELLLLKYCFKTKKLRSKKLLM